MEVYNEEDVGQRRIYCIVSSLHISYEEVLRTSFLGMETIRRLFDGVYEYVVISFQSMIYDEAVARGRDLTFDGWTHH
jgi:hypothetical protein